MRKVLSLKPAYAPAHNFLANALRSAGDIAGAEEHFAEAIRLDPQAFDAHYNYAQTHRYVDHDPHLSALETLYLERGDLEERQRANLGFALASAYDQLQRYDLAFKHLQEANADWRRTLEYRKERTRHLFKAIQESFAEPPLEIPSQSDGARPTPIFIVGMPRSGTSLLEQMLARHSRIRAAGELTALGKLCRSVPGGFPRGYADIQPDTLATIGNSYREQLVDWGDDFVIDKMPTNFLYLWIIRAALPEARIIHCRRDPMDTCLSIYQRLFSRGHEYAYELGELGDYYRHYQQLLGHWEKRLGAVVYSSDYEKLVQQPRDTLTAILAHCGLDFEAACTETGPGGGVVATASASQVRQPLYTHSVGRWQHYRQQLAPLRAALPKCE